MASKASKFWARRREFDSSPGDDGGDDTDRQLVLLVDIDDDAVRSAHGRIATELDDFECLAPAPFEAPPHGQTLRCLRQWDRRDDPVVNRIDEIVSSVVTDVSPFDVEFTRFNLFPDVVYAEVDAGGHLDTLNQRLCAHPEVATFDRGAEAFIPHLTLGYFVDDTDHQALVTSLETDREVSLPQLTVDELALVAYGVGGGWPPTYDRLKTCEL
jgi:2'-5' RNA ligase